MSVKPREIKTTGQLRKFLAETIVKVGDGSIGLDEASRITKLAAQVNESFYSEIKIAKTQWEIGAQSESKKLGDLPLE